MVYTSLTSNLENPKYNLHVAHLYGDLMNTYGDNGNILMLKYVGEKLGAEMTFDIVSLEDSFDQDFYDLVFWGGGQDYEQEIIADSFKISQHHSNPILRLKSLCLPSVAAIKC